MYSNVGDKNMENILIANIAELSGVTTGMTAQSDKPIWRKMPYETMSGIKGEMVISSAHGTFSDLNIPLPAIGHCRIYAGMACFGEMTKCRWRLEGERFWNCVNTMGINWFPECMEYLLAETDLTGQHFELRHEPNITTLAWLRLEPCNVSQKQTCSCIATLDGYCTDTLENYYERISSLAGGNVERIQFCLAQCDFVSHYKTKVGTQGAKVRHPIYLSELYHAIEHNMTRLLQEEPLLLPKLIDFTHENGMEFFGAIRLGACYMPGMGESSNFFLEHPEYHCRTYSGIPIARLSFAVPEVRRHFLELIDEMTDFDLDGLNLILMRSVPLVAFEPAFCSQFEERYGISPLKLKENDSKILQLRGKIITDFFRDIRMLLDRKGNVRGRRFNFSLDVMATQEANRNFGIDLEILVAEKIVDSLEVDGALMMRNHNEKVGNIDLKYFGKLCQSMDCRWYPKGEGKTSFGVNGEGLPALFHEARNYGASGLFLWDAYEHMPKWRGRWETLTNLLSGIEPAQAPNRLFLLRTLDGFDYDQFTPHNAF